MEVKKVKTVGLFGTCNDSKWRDEIIKRLPSNFDYFNPVVDDWTEDCIVNENKHKEDDDFVVFVITPNMKGVYSIAEVTDLSNKRDNVIFCVLHSDIDSYGGVVTFDEGQKKSLNAVKNLLFNNGVTICNSLDEIVEYLKKRSD